jgi:hypothetical protein
MHIITNACSQYNPPPNEALFIKYSSIKDNNNSCGKYKMSLILIGETVNDN